MASASFSRKIKGNFKKENHLDYMYHFLSNFWSFIANFLRYFGEFNIDDMILIHMKYCRLCWLKYHDKVFKLFFWPLWNVVKELNKKKTSPERDHHTADFSQYTAK